MSTLRPKSTSRWVLTGLAIVMAIGIPLAVQAAPWDGKRYAFASSRFERVWRAADEAVQQGRATRSWTWGPQPWFDYREVYIQAPAGQRLVQYFDKARMELTDPSNRQGPLDGVTNGLLTVELVSARVKVGDGIGDDQNQLQSGCFFPVAGDLTEDGLPPNPRTPSYTQFHRVATVDNGYRDPQRLGQRVGTTFEASGVIGFRQDLANFPGTELVAYESVTGHNVPHIFDTFQNASPVPALATFGYPITDPYWIVAQVNGTDRDVLVQLFERRVLTYTPSNPEPYKVEMGNVGQHYFRWRYLSLGTPWATPDPALPIIFASQRDEPVFQVYSMDPNGGRQTALTYGGNERIPFSIGRSWNASSIRILASSTRYTGKPQVVSLGGSNPKHFELRHTISEANDYQGVRSPDHRNMLFVSDVDGNPELYLFFVHGRTPQLPLRLTHTTRCSNQHPTWLPDGAGIVYESDCQDGNFELYRSSLRYTLETDSDTGKRYVVPVLNTAMRLTNNAVDDRFPRLSPDGKELAFASTRDGNWEIYAMGSDGSVPTRLTRNAAIDQAPTWSPNGTQVAFTSDRDGDQEIFVMNSDGSGLSQLTNNAAADGHAIWAQ